LRHHPHNLGGLRRGHQIARALDAQARISFQPGLVAGRAGRTRQIGGLMHDDLRGGSLHRPSDRSRVKDIDHRRRGAEYDNGGGLVGRPRRADDFMAGGTQQRREPPPDCPARSGQKYPHGLILNRPQ
jgi:hypothetical protein